MNIIAIMGRRASTTKMSRSASSMLRWLLWDSSWCTPKTAATC